MEISFFNRYITEETLTLGQTTVTTTTPVSTISPALSLHMFSFHRNKNKKRMSKVSKVDA